MFKNFLNIVNTKYGKIIISIVLGIGLASIFRKSCDSRNCIIFQAPSFEEVNENIYKHDGKCFKYKEDNVNCDSNKQTVEIA